MKLYSHTALGSGCRWHRNETPCYYWAKDFPDHEVILFIDNPKERMDCYYLYGLLTGKTVQMVGKWKREPCVFVSSFDDLQTQVPDHNPFQPPDAALDWFPVQVAISDLIIASTPRLASHFPSEKVIVARNLMDVASYQTTKPFPAQNGCVRIAWSGSATHLLDLTIIEEACVKVLEKWGDKVEFVFCGGCPDLLLRDYLNRGVHIENPVPLAQYPSLMRAIAPNIILAPLEDTEFTRCKSSIRLMEANCLNCPYIASRTGEYSQWGVEGETGLYATTSEEWFEAMNTLIEDEQLRMRMGTRGYEYVKEFGDWSNKSCRKDWIKVFEKMIHLCNGAEK